jgi:hypothetical protein
MRRVCSLEPYRTNHQCFTMKSKHLICESKIYFLHAIDKFSGKWGVAHYFAENASYSDNDAYVLNEKKQIILAKVLVGDSTTIMPNDTLLRKPPAKSSGGEYDSVNGETDMSTVYMIYENGRAYPDYLITYQ